MYAIWIRNTSETWSNIPRICCLGQYFTFPLFDITADTQSKMNGEMSMKYILRRLSARSDLIEVLITEFSDLLSRHVR